MTGRYIESKTQKVSVDGIDFVYRIMGEGPGVPIICFNHLAGVLDDWDPRVIDGIAKEHTVLTFDNRGIGASGGETPKTVEAMADDAIAFIKVLGYEKVDLFGFSLGGCVAQIVTLKEPQLIRRLILAGTGPAGALGADKIRKLCYKCQLKSFLFRKDVREYLFFTSTENGKQEAKEFIGRVNERKADRDTKISMKSFLAQLDAIDDFALQDEFDLSHFKLPVLIANGESDSMVYSINSAHMYLGMPDSRLVLYKDAGHGGVFQYYNEFVGEVRTFLCAED